MSLTPCEETPVRPCAVGGEGVEEEFREIELDVEEEAREPQVLRDPGAPTEAEVEKHNVTHLPFRSWCPACVEGKARDKHHKKREYQHNKEIPEIVFDYGFMGAEGEETIAIQVAKDRRTRMIFAHVVPKKGITHEHGAAEMTKDIAKLGYNEVILKCDGEPALKNVQDEVKKQRAQKTILENSPVGDSQANGAAERAVQAVAEQVRVLRRGLEQRLGVRLSGKHPVTAWLVEHAADLLSKYQIGDDGKTGYERWKGKRFQQEEVEFGEKIHYRENLKARAKQLKLEARWGEGFYLGRWWRTGEAIIGTASGILRGGSIRRVGAHRRWDREGLERVRGLPWQWNPAEVDLHPELKVRWLREEELESGQPLMSEDSRNIYRLRLRRQDFFEHGFSEGCVGCQALIAGSAARGHSDACRKRMEEAIAKTEEGQRRQERQELKENEALAKRLEKHRGEADGEGTRKRARNYEEPTTDASQSSSSSAAIATSSTSAGAVAPSSGTTAQIRHRPDDDEDWTTLAAKTRRRDHQDEHVTDVEAVARGGFDFEQLTDGMDIDNISFVERTMQEDMTWTLDAVSDMCMPEDPFMRQINTDFMYYDENTWEPLDTKMVIEAEKAELKRFQDMGVYEYISRAEAMNDPEGKFVKVKWVRINKGTANKPEIKCRLVAQELGYGQRMDELFSGTPSLSTVKLVIAHAAKGGQAVAS